MSEAKKVAINTIIQVAGKTVTIFLALIGFGVMARYLGADGFGYFATIYGILAVFGILADLGLQMTITKMISDGKYPETEILSNAVTMRFVFSVIFLGAVSLAITAFPYPDVVKVGVFVASIGFVFGSLVATLTSFFQKHLIMQHIAAAEVGGKLLFVFGVIAAAALNWGLLGVIAAVVVDSIFIFLVLIVVAKSKINLKAKFDWSFWKLILRTTWPVGITIALNLVYFKGDIFIMSLVRPEAEVGLYGAPYRILEVIINIGYVILGLLLPIMSAAAAVQNMEKFKKVIAATFDSLLIVCVPLVVGGLFVGVPMMELLAGSEFSVSGEVIKILLLATAAILIAGLFGYAVVAIEQQKQMIKFYLVNAVFSVTAYIILIPRYTFWAAAWITVFSEMVILVSAIYVLYKSSGYLPKIKNFLPITCATILMSVFLHFFSFIHVIPLITLGGLIYLATFYLVSDYNLKKLRQTFSW